MEKFIFGNVTDNWKKNDVLNAYFEAPKNGLKTLINNKSIIESLESGTEMSSRVIQIIGARLNK